MGVKRNMGVRQHTSQGMVGDSVAAAGRRVQRNLGRLVMRRVL